MKTLKNLINDESGAAAIEYVVLAGVGAGLALSIGSLIGGATGGLQAGINADVLAAGGEPFAP